MAKAVPFALQYTNMNNTTLETGTYEIICNRIAESFGVALQFKINENKTKQQEIQKEIIMLKIKANLSERIGMITLKVGFRTNI